MYSNIECNAPANCPCPELWGLTAQHLSSPESCEKTLGFHAFKGAKQVSPTSSARKACAFPAPG
ncbi:hypothetical protein T11_13748 [Trichinella zimbabwensis]|uniref:Uncharacterized protein n=1 Tax=Trichinella zimbabwensis TaxID=268475 RepID=A0A0V1GDT4_9BILA|nr:hypothetical protein T11_13748 [Trichinella zimbabwensis]